MDPKKWINISHETDLGLDPEIIQGFEENMGRDAYAMEPGSKLPPYGHWFFNTEKSQNKNELSLPDSHNLYWHSGKVLFEKSLILGNNCSKKLRIRNVEKIDGTDSSYLITTEYRLVSAGSFAVDEEQILLLTDQIEPHEKIRRINFDPDWNQDVQPGMIESIRAMKSTFFENPVADMFTQAETREKKAIRTGGSPGLILLIESFLSNFESRAIDRITYRSFGYSFDGVISIAGQDSDAFVTSLRIINSKRQVLYSADIRWSYSW